MCQLPLALDLTVCRYLKLLQIPIVDVRINEKILSIHRHFERKWKKIRYILLNHKDYE